MRKNEWDGFSCIKVFRDKTGAPFEYGLPKYEVSYHNILIGYAEDLAKAEKMFIEYRNRTK